MPKYSQLPRSVYVQRVENVKQLECVLSGGCVISLWLRQVFVKFGLLIQIWPWRSTSINPKNYSDFNQVFCISSPNLMSLAWMDDKSSHRKRNSWLTYAFVAVNSNVLAQASYFLIERRQIVFLCWMQDLNPVSLKLNHQQTECPLTNRLRYRGSLELNSPSLWSASIQPTWPDCRLAFKPGSGNIYMFVVVNSDALAQARHF